MKQLINMCSFVHDEDNVRVCIVQGKDSITFSFSTIYGAVDMLNMIDIDQIDGAFVLYDDYCGEHFKLEWHK